MKTSNVSESIRHIFKKMMFQTKYIGYFLFKATAQIVDVYQNVLNVRISSKVSNITIDMSVAKWEH